jgi:putative peptidoglycan lipid II flippase
MPERQVQEILTRTQRLSRIDMPGVARVLDVARTGSGGLVVSEWIRGGSLAEVADTTPSPIGGARAIQSLAAAAEVAHRNGVALSVDHPSRIRVSIDGDVALAFPATLPDATPDDDIRGIGAALYALLIDRWPLPESGESSGLAPADRDAAGHPVEPKAVDHDIPFQISAAAARAVQEGGGIRSAPTLLNLLQQATAIADRTDHIAPIEDVAPEPRSSGSWLGSTSDPESDTRRRKGLIVGLSVAAVIVVVAVVLLATVLSRIFGDVGSGLGGDELGLNDPSSSEQAPPGDDGSVIKPVRATVFSPEGEADAPELAALAIDGNPATVWPTDTYSDPAPFPGFKNGVGLMLQLSQPTTLGSVTINVNSTGTAVQIRSSDSATPSSLDDTTALTQPTPLKSGPNTIEVDDAEPTSYVLVWISTLGQVNGESRSDVSEVTLKAAS